MWHKPIGQMRGGAPDIRLALASDMTHTIPLMAPRGPTCAHVDGPVRHSSSCSLIAYMCNSRLRYFYYMLMAWEGPLVAISISVMAVP